MAAVHEELKRWHDWTDPEYFQEGQQRETRFWRLFLRQLMPGQSSVQRTKLTLTGWFLILVALGIGMAAYNAASNILFMTLSLLLSSLVLSGILSQINFKKLEWELVAPANLRVGEPGVAEVSTFNGKRLFPSICLCFRVGSSAEDVLRRLYLSRSLRAGERMHLDWQFTPQRRGSCEVKVVGMESAFPFGFIYKTIGIEQSTEVWVWPARVEYSFAPDSGGHRRSLGVSRTQPGQGSDLLNIRAYQHGDAPRLVHWKASARMGKLMIRQLAKEGERAFVLSLNLSNELWDAESFERMCSVAASLAEDLFHAGRLEGYMNGSGEFMAVRSLRDLQDFFNYLAAAVPEVDTAFSGVVDTGYSARVSLMPSANNGVNIYVDDVLSGEAHG